MSKFITIEGTDCSGKSSVVFPYLQEKLQNTVFVKDLKDGEIGSKIREIFMDPTSVNETTNWRTIAFLSAAARSDLVTTKVIPALSAGQHVVSDRYVDTAFVYNLESDKAPIDTILNLSTHLVYPHIVLFTTCSYEEMVKRKSTRDDNDSWDISSEEEYNEKIERYKERLYNNGATIVEIDSTLSIESVKEQLDQFIETHLGQ